MRAAWPRWVRTMATHLERTAESRRSADTFPAVIAEVRQLTADTRLLEVEANTGFRFLPGQWVDFMIPDGPVGGFSMASSPSSLPRFSLAVKKSSNAAAAWVHSPAAAPGTKVHVRVGGSFHCDTTSLPAGTHLLCIAGGVGINPLLSMALAFAERRGGGGGDGGDGCRVTLLYSVRTLGDVAFREELAALNKRSDVDVRVHVTRGDGGDGDGDGDGDGGDSGGVPVVTGRIDGKREADALVRRCGSTTAAQVYLCGPPPMAEAIERDMHIPVLYEKWW